MINSITADEQKLKHFLERKVAEYNRISFIKDDPVSVPHTFSKKQDVEIAGFFSAVFAWGNRTTIINKASELMSLMDNAPYEFILHHEEYERQRFEKFVHRTFNSTDLIYFISFLQRHYQQHSSLEDAFLKVSGSKASDEKMEDRLNEFYRYFVSLEDVPDRTRKHIAAPFKKSACKRLNMFLRWMVRNDGKGVDFGLWRRISAAELIVPLDLHVARVARRFNLLQRPVADWLSAIELTQQLRKIDPRDPARYDYALFALGINEKF